MNVVTILVKERWRPAPYGVSNLFDARVCCQKGGAQSEGGAARLAGVIWVRICRRAAAAASPEWSLQRLSVAPVFVVVI